VPVYSSCLQAPLSGREARSVRCGRPCRSELATCAAVPPFLAVNSGSVHPGLAASASSAAVSRNCFPLPLPPDILSRRCASEDATTRADVALGEVLHRGPDFSEAHISTRRSTSARDFAATLISTRLRGTAS
jgi:hypothetical protein